MSFTAAVGQAQAIDGREAGLQATHRALNALGTSPPTLAIVIASHQYEARQVINGISSLLTNVPLVGFSAPAGLTQDGQRPRSVVVALLSSDRFQAEAHWFSEYAQSGRETALRLKRSLSSPPGEDSVVLIFADGFNGDAEQFCAHMQDVPLVIGGLSCGDLHTGHTYQFANNRFGMGSLAAAYLYGGIRVGLGSAHGWDPVGGQFRVTRSRGFWLRTLDGRPASEAYAQLFGHPAREWAFPPLNHLVRLYPLGLEQEEGLRVRSPMRVEADGSFRMNAPIPEGLDAYLMVGSPANCQRAARQAAQEALQGLGKARPVFALVLVDIAWQLLLKAQPGLEIAAVQDILGDEVPIAGGYTLGQIVPGEDRPHFLNQHITVLLFGEE